MLTVDKQITILRIIQEQLKNVIRYSRAKEVTIEIFIHENNVKLSIVDNGEGFDPFQKKKGIGLNNIYDRAQSHQGSVDLQTAPGKGCALSIYLPAA